MIALFLLRFFSTVLLIHALFSENWTAYFAVDPDNGTLSLVTAIPAEIVTSPQIVVLELKVCTLTCMCESSAKYISSMLL